MSFIKAKFNYKAFLRVPVTCIVGAIEKKPIVEDNKIKIAPILGINVTIDHRFLDGIRSVQLLQIVIYSNW